MSLAYKTMKSPVGKLKLVASDKGLVAILWENDGPRRVRMGELVEEKQHPVLIETEQQLGEYFAGKRKTFGRLCLPYHLVRRGVTGSWQSNLGIPGRHGLWARRTDETLYRSLFLATA